MSETQEQGDGPEVLVSIRAVMEKLGAQGIPKSGRNKDQNYNFRGIEQFLAALNPLLVENDLLILPRVLSHTHLERTTKSGSSMLSAVVEVEWDICSVVDDSKVTVRTFGEGQDVSDKSTNKAMSAAYKYMAILTFCIPTEGEADESDAETPEQSRPAQQQQRDGGGEQRQQQQRKPGPTSAELRAEGAWERYIGEMKTQRNVTELKAWAAKVAPVINTWPTKWGIAFQEEYTKFGQELTAKAKAASAGPPADEDDGPPR